MGGGIRLDTVDQRLDLDREALSNLGLGIGSGLYLYPSLYLRLYLNLHPENVSLLR